MASLFAEDYESGTAGNNVTTGTSTYTTLTASAKFTFSNTYAHGGTLSGKFVLTADTVTARWEWTPSSIVWWRGYLYFPSLPAADSVIGVVYNGTTVVARLKVLATGQIRLDDATTASVTSSASIATGAWVRFAWKVDPATTSGASSQVLRLYQGSQLEQPVGAYTEQLTGTAYRAAQTQVSEIRRGLTVAGTLTYYTDDDALDDATEPNPTGTTGGGDVVIASPTMDASAEMASGSVLQEFLWRPPTMTAVADLTADITVEAAAGNVTIRPPSMVAFADMEPPTLVRPSDAEQDPPHLWTTRIRVAFTDWAGDPMWTDVSQWTDSRAGIDITRGRSDRLAETQTGTMSLVLGNRDGRFTPGNLGSPYYPNVKLGKPITVDVIDTAKNWMLDPSFEAWSQVWFTAAMAYLGYVACQSFSQSTTEKNSGSYSAKVTWAAAASGTGVGINVSGLTIGSVYTASAYVYVPTGSPDVRVDVPFIATGALTSTKDEWVRVTCTFTATNTYHLFALVAESADAGDVCYLDDVQVELGSSATAFDSTGATITPRFAGEVTSWPMTWPGSVDTYAESRLTASDGFKRLGRLGELRSMVEEEHRLLAPAGYWPLEDGGAALSAGAADTYATSPMVQAQVGTGGELTFGTDLEPVGGVKGAWFVPADGTNGKYLYGSVRGGGLTSDDWSVSLMFTGSTVSRTLLFVQALAGYLRIGTDPSGYLEAQWVVGSAQWTINNGEALSALTADEPHHVVVTGQDMGSSLTIRLYLDGVREVLYAGPVGPVLTPHGRLGIAVGGLDSLPMWSGVVGHVAYWDSTLTDAQVARLAGCRTGWHGDTTDQRVTRLAQYAGLGTDELDMGATSSTLSAQPTQGVTALAAMLAATAAENGQLTWGRDGRLQLRGRVARYDTAPTLVVTGEELSAPPEFALDEVMLDAAGNDVTVTRPGGASQRVVNATSVADYGPRRQTLDVPLADDQQAASAAAWRVNTYGEPAVACSSLEADLVTTATETLRSSLAAADVGTRLTLMDLPAGAPAESIDLFIEGYSERIALTEWKIRYNTSPADAWPVWTVEDPVLGIVEGIGRVAY